MLRTMVSEMRTWADRRAYCKLHSIAASAAVAFAAGGDAVGAVDALCRPGAADGVAAGAVAVAAAAAKWSASSVVMVDLVVAN